MATPIQYTPQPIFTDIGVFERQLQQDQQRYDRAMTQRAAMEDQFAQVPTHPADLPVKQEVMGKFQEDVESIVDRYGGDYGAAAKDLTRKLSKTRQNPFFQLAPRRMKLAEEQRKRQQELGPNAYTTKDVLEQPLKDPETGEWIAPEDLQSQVLDQRMYEEQLASNFGELAGKTRYGDYIRNQQHPWMLERNVYQGITDQEEPEYAEQMFQHLMSQNPELPEDLARNMSRNYAAQLNQGIKKKDQIEDPEYMAGIGSDTDSYGRPVYQRYTGTLSQSDRYDKIRSNAEENMQRVADLENTRQHVGKVTDILRDYNINPAVTEDSVTTFDAPMSKSTRESIDRVENDEYSLGDLKNKWSYNIRNAVGKAASAAGQFASNLSPEEENKRFDKIRNIVDTAFEKRYENPEELSRLLSVLGEDHEYVKQDPETGLYTFDNKGLDLLRKGRESEILVDLSNELQSGVSRSKSRLEKEGKKLEKYIKDNPVITETMEVLKQNNPEMDDISVAQTAIEAASKHKQEQAATHFNEIDIYDDNISDNTYRRIKASSDKVPAVQIEGGEVEDDDVNMKEVLSDDVSIVDMRYIPGENKFKITTDEAEGNNYKVDATNSDLLPTEAVKMQENVSKFLGNLRDLSFENTEEFDPQVVVDGIPYSAVKAYDPETNQFHTSITTLNAQGEEIPITEGEFLTRYADSVSRRLGYQRNRQPEKVQ